MNSGFFGNDNIRDLKIAVGILSVIALSCLSAFLAFALFRSVLFSMIALPIFATLSALGIFGPSENRAKCWFSMASVSVVFLIVGGLVTVESATYQSIFTSIWNFIKGLACIAIVVLLIIGFFKAWLDESLKETNDSTSHERYATSDKKDYSDWDDDEDNGLVYKVEENSIDALIDALNEDEIDPFDIEMLIDDGAKNARISFRYKKPNERARRRKVIVKKIDGDCLGCIDLSDRSYKNFRLDRISDARHT